MATRWRPWIGWSAVLVLGCALGGWLSMSRVSAGRGGLLPHPTARLLIQTTPEMPFKLEIWRTLERESMVFDGASPVELDLGDYTVDLLPESDLYQRKRLKIHLSAQQQLVLPVTLRQVRSP